MIRKFLFKKRKKKKKQTKIQSLFSFQQVTKAYQAKVKELINQGLDEEELRSEQDVLKVRKYYDSIYFRSYIILK